MRRVCLIGSGSFIGPMRVVKGLPRSLLRVFESTAVKYKACAPLLLPAVCSMTIFVLVDTLSASLVMSYQPNHPQCIQGGLSLRFAGSRPDALPTDEQGPTSLYFFCAGWVDLKSGFVTGEAAIFRCWWS